MSNTAFSCAINKPFIFGLMAKSPDKRTGFALKVARERHKWSQADFARKLNVSDQVMTNWVSRGVPRKEWPHVAKTLGISVEELDRCRINVAPTELPAEAVEFARDWYSLTPVARSQIQGLVRTMIGDRGPDDKDVVDGPTLQRRRGA